MARRLTRRASELRASGVLEGIPAAEMLLASRPLITTFALQRTGTDAVLTATDEMIKVFEKYPVLLTAYRKHSVTQWVLDFLDVACGSDDGLRQRTQMLRARTPASDMVQDLQGDVSEEFVHGIHALVTRAQGISPPMDPSSTLTTTTITPCDERSTGAASRTDFSERLMLMEAEVSELQELKESQELKELEWLLGE
jgi:hypothetical protein